QQVWIGWISCKKGRSGREGYSTAAIYHHGQMPPLTKPFLVDAGAQINLLVGLIASAERAFHRAGQPIPSPIFAQALIDPGAAVTCIDSAIVQNLRIKSTGQKPIITPGSATGFSCNIYEVKIRLVHPFSRPNLDLVVDSFPVVETRLTHLGVELLIGR